MNARPLVVIDGRVLGNPSGGFGRYVTLLLEGLLAHETPGYDFRVLVDEKVPKGWSWLGDRAWPVSVPFLSLSECLQIPRLLHDSGAALYHSPTFSSLLSSRMPCPWVITVHDLNHLTYGGVGKKLYYNYLLKPFLRRAAQALTVSEFSRGEMQAWLGSSMDIQLAENALSSTWLDEVNTLAMTAAAQAILARWQLKSGEYFFSLTNPKPHKNSQLLTEAYLKYREQGGAVGSSSEPWPLVLTTPVDSAFQELGVIRLGHISTLEAGVLLKHSGALFFPSLYEGFGLPPIEAAALGVRIVVSDIAPHREGLRFLRPHEALWINPRDFHGWTQAFHRVRRGELGVPSMESGQRLRDYFSPERMAIVMNQVYRKALGFDTVTP